MKAKDILYHFLNAGTWVNKETTVDKIIIGDPEKEIKTVLVTWMSTFESIKEAARDGISMIITHEPTFWQHENEIETMNTEIFDGIAVKKKDFIEKSGIVILRCHDFWDGKPENGIPWAWAEFLGLGNKPTAISSDGYILMFDTKPVALEDFAKQIAEKTANIGEPYVQVCGSPNKLVSKVSVGTGCICDPAEMQKIGCDVAIVCDDGTSYWHDIQPAKDSDFPVIRVNHGTSEEPGMLSLFEYVKENFPGLEVSFKPHGSAFRLVGK